jgi:hypothetical protein
MMSPLAVTIDLGMAALATLATANTAALEARFVELFSVVLLDVFD